MEDSALWTKYGGDSDDESGSVESKDDDDDSKTLEDKEGDEHEKKTALDRQNATMARQIKEVIEATRLEIGKATGAEDPRPR